MRKPLPIPDDLVKNLVISENGDLPFWKANPCRYGGVAGTINKRGYRVVWHNRKPYLFHRVAFKRFYGFEPIMVDHVDGDVSNNSKVNLRAASPCQNMRNRRPTKNTSSVYKGVSFKPKAGKWVVKICKNGEQKYLGIFDNEITAAEAYDRAAKVEHSEFARLNFPK